MKVTFFKKILKLNIRSIFLNLYLFPLKDAIRLPLLINSSVKITSIYRGGIQIHDNSLHPGMIQIGYNGVGTIDLKRDKSILQIHKGGVLSFDGPTSIGTGSNISVGPKGSILFGKNVCITGKSTLISHKEISIGSGSLISWDCIFIDTDFHHIEDSGTIINKPECIVINVNCWIGCRCTILKGSELPAGSVLGAGSLLSKKVSEANCVYCGNPVRIIKHNIIWNK